MTASATTTTTTTSSTVPGSSTTPTTIPADVYTNTQSEPWNPVPCTLGAPATTTGHDHGGDGQGVREAQAKSAARPDPKPAKSPLTQADLRRCRTMRRRSRSVVPPQTPSRSRWARACSRHA